MPLASRSLLTDSKVSTPKLRYCPATSRMLRKTQIHHEAQGVPDCPVSTNEAEAEKAGAGTFSFSPSRVDSRVNLRSSPGSRLQCGSSSRVGRRARVGMGTTTSRSRPVPRGQRCSPGAKREQLRNHPRVHMARPQQQFKGARRLGRRGADYKSRHASGRGGPAQEPGPAASQAQACAVVLGSGGAGPPRLSAGARGARAAVVAAIGGEAGGAGPPRAAVG